MEHDKCSTTVLIKDQSCNRMQTDSLDCLLQKASEAYKTTSAKNINHILVHNHLLNQEKQLLLKTLYVHMISQFFK